MALLLQPLDVLLPRQRRVRGVRVEPNRALGQDPLLAIMVARLADGIALSRVFIIPVREIRNLEVLRKRELVPDFEVSAAEHGRVDGEEHGLVACGFCALDQFDAVVALFEEVELERCWGVADCVFDVLEGLCCEAAQPHDGVLRLAGPGCCNLAVRVREAVHCGAGGADGGADFLAEDIYAGVDDGDVAEDARADAVFLVGADVLGERAAAVCAFVVVVASLLVHALGCEDAELFDGQAVQVGGLVVRHGDGIGGSSLDRAVRWEGECTQQWLQVEAPLSLYQAREMVSMTPFPGSAN